MVELPGPHIPIGGSGNYSQGEGGSGLPTGWTQDESDPANVDANGGSLTVLGLTAAGQVNADGLDVVSAGTIGAGLVITDGGINVNGGNISVNGGGSINLDGGGIDTGGGYTDTTLLTVRGDLDHNGAAVGFYGTTPTAQPEIPATPTAQDIADALITLGLATQA